MQVNAIELTITAVKVAESLEIGRSTLSKYSRSLEEAGYSFIKDERGNRAYTERDIITLRHAITLLSKGVAYDKAMADSALKYAPLAPATPHADHVAMDATETSESTEITGLNASSSATLQAFRQELTAEIATYIADATEALRSENEELRSILKETLYRLDDMSKQNRQLTELVSVQQQIAAALPSPAAQRAGSVTDRLTERKIEKQLEREALERWSTKPENERTRKAGLFRKEEDITARDRYVREYVEQHYESRIRREYGL